MPHRLTAMKTIGFGLIGTMVYRDQIGKQIKAIYIAGNSQIFDLAVKVVII